jgi:hypothetical protein
MGKTRRNLAVSADELATMRTFLSNGHVSLPVLHQVSAAATPLAPHRPCEKAGTMSQIDGMRRAYSTPARPLE